MSGKSWRPLRDALDVRSGLMAHLASDLAPEASYTYLTPYSRLVFTIGSSTERGEEV